MQWMLKKLKAVDKIINSNYIFHKLFSKTRKQAKKKRKNYKNIQHK